MNVMQLASGVSPTRDLVDAPITINVMQTGIGIGLQGALEVFKMAARMFSLAIL
jgi:hypothetical protein